MQDPVYSVLGLVLSVASCLRAGHQQAGLERLLREGKLDPYFMRRNTN